MRKIKDIYEEYKIMPNLQMHQLRVAGVVSQLCDSLNLEVTKETLIITCLLHDMGNIIKSRLDYFPEFIKPEGLGYWQNVKDEFIQKYGEDEHEATVQIIKELGLPERVVNLAGKTDFHICVNTAKQRI
jgi:hypothetical protein